MINFKYLILFLSLCTTFVHAQKENYNWTFGNNAGLTWNVLKSFPVKDYFGVAGDNLSDLNDLPTPFRSSVKTSEGCFTVSDYTGKLLFYSDGMTIYQKDNANTNPSISTDKVVENGTGMLGNASSAQSGIIIPYPGNSSQYIAVSLGTHYTENNITYNDSFLAWSVVKIRDDGNAEVVPHQKNLKILPEEGYIYKEIVTAVRAANKKDYWIIAPAREYNTNTSFRNNYLLDVYKVDENGVSTKRVSQGENITSLPTNTTATWSSYGQIKFNKAGNRFALVTHNRNNGDIKHNNLLIGDFDNATGKITILSERSIGVNGEQLYSVEFDHTDQFIYMTTAFTYINNANSESHNLNFKDRLHTLYVYNVNDLINKDQNGQYVISTENLKDYGIKKTVPGNTTNFFGSISRGIDNRMYITEYGNRNLYIITNPENPIPTTSDKLTNLNIYLLENYLVDKTNGSLGLPSYASFYFNVNMDKVNICKDTPTTFTINITGGEGGDDYSRTEIDFGDNSSIETLENNGLNKSYTLTHQYPNDGIYTIRMTSYDLQNNVIEASSSTVEATVSTCQIKVNPHIRINL